MSKMSEVNENESTTSNKSLVSNVEDCLGKLLVKEEIEDEQKEKVAEIPTLVVEIFLHWNHDVELLKTCRLVNKCWNRLACLALQNNSIAKFCIDDQRLEDFIEFHESLSAEDLPLHPSPFKIVHIHSDESQSESYFRLVRIPNITITSITTCTMTYNGCGVEWLNQLLKATMKDLTNLSINILLCNNAKDVFDDVKFLALQRLYIDKFIHWSDENNCMEPLNKALENSKLQELTVGPNNFIHGSCSPSSFLNVINLSSIVKLNLWDDLEEQVWDRLSQLQLPSIKAFHFRQKGKSANKTKLKLLNDFLLNNASKLEKLIVMCKPEPEDFGLIFPKVVFPKLKDLGLTCPKDISLFATPERFPVLHSLFVDVSTVPQMEFESDGSDSLGTVRKLKFSIHMTDDENPLPVNMLFPSWMLNLAKKFPEIEWLDVGLSPDWISFSLVDISRAYPNLESLRIGPGTPYTYLFLSGTCKIGPKPVDDLGANEMANQDIPLLDFKKLITLDLGGIEISTEAFQHCFPQMQALEAVQFTYRPGPSLKTLAASLKHVKYLIIQSEGGEGDSQADPTLVALVKALPFSKITLI